MLVVSRTWLYVLCFRNYIFSFAAHLHVKNSKAEIHSCERGRDATPPEKFCLQITSFATCVVKFFAFFVF